MWQVSARAGASGPAAGGTMACPSAIEIGVGVGIGIGIGVSCLLAYNFKFC
jgi:hypothetical protein